MLSFNLFGFLCFIDNYLDLPDANLCRERTIHVIYDPSVFSSKVLMDYLKIGEINETTLPQLQVDLLASIYLMWTKNLDMMSTILEVDRDTIGLEYLTKDEITKFFEESSQIMEEAVLM